MTDVIRAAAGILRDAAHKDDYTSYAVIACKEADGDYNFFINTLNNYIGILQNVIQKLVEERNNSTGIVTDCIVHRCDLCRINCEDKRQEGKVCGCFMYTNKPKQLYIVE